MDEDWRSQDFQTKSVVESAIKWLWICAGVMIVVVPLVALLLG